MTRTQNFDPSHNEDFDMHTTESQFNRRKDFSERILSKPMFACNGPKCAGELMHRDAPAGKRKVNTRLESLPHNPPVKDLLPAREELSRQKQSNIRKVRVLTKIDESLLSNAARERNEQSRDCSMSTVENIKKHIRK